MAYTWYPGKASCGTVAKISFTLLLLLNCPKAHMSFASAISLVMVPDESAPT